MGGAVFDILAGSYKNNGGGYSRLTCTKKFSLDCVRYNYSGMCSSCKKLGISIAQKPKEAAYFCDNLSLLEYFSLNNCEYFQVNTRTCMKVVYTSIIMLKDITSGSL